MNLLPCPFCGDKRPLINDYDSDCHVFTFFYVQCFNCLASVDEAYESLQEAAKHWNKRVIPLSQPLPN